jgi:hypothetical protein
MPWWQEVAEIVEGARARHGVDVAVLRLLRGHGEGGTAGGDVTYLAEALGPPPIPLAPWPSLQADPLADHPLRLPYARPGGPAADLLWAHERLAAAGYKPAGPPRQVRTWNLSSIWRVPLSGGEAWLKVVPPFFAHEGAMLRRLDPAVVPPLIAAEGPRALMHAVPGTDHRGAPLPVLLRVLELLVGLQSAWVGRLGEIAATGAPDWRAAAFVPAAEAAVRATEAELDTDTNARLRRLIDGLPARFAKIAECGVPDTLVHGDFHPGNTRGPGHEGGHHVLLDWGDCGVGNPLLDQAAFVDRIEPGQREPVLRRWTELWRDAAPASDPGRAAALLAPVAPLRQAMVYCMFLDRIEPDERIYHRDDPAPWLRRAAAE